MASYQVQRIIAADRLNEGLVIKFEDGRIGFYSSYFLYARLPEIEELDDEQVTF